MKLRQRGLVGQPDTKVTARETEHRALARRAASEGFVLLKNENNLLPLKKGTKIALYGTGAVRTVKGGTGSGDVNERDCVSIYQGFQNAGFELTTVDWLEKLDRDFEDAQDAWVADIKAKMAELGPERFFEAFVGTPFIRPAGDLLDEAKASADGADTAVYVLSRIAGEGADRHDEKGDYYLTDSEEALLQQIERCYEHIIVIINTGGIVDLGFTDHAKIQSVIQFMQAGQEGGNALCDVLLGDVTPSGKLTDSWPISYNDYPCALTFGYKNGDILREDYTDDIYVGYRYFDTFDVPVRYCFGYGLSYTSFDVKAGNIRVNGMGTLEPRISVDIQIQNTGSEFAGKEVAQVYVSCPQGTMEKEFRRLAGFMKTKLLKPGEIEKKTVSFPLYSLASYDENCSTYLLEEGVYGIWVGNSLSSASLYGSIRLDGTAAIKKCTPICKMQKDIKTLKQDESRKASKAAKWTNVLSSLPQISIKATDLICETIAYSCVPSDFDGKAGEILSSLSDEQLIRLATGEPSMGQGSMVGDAGQTVPGAAAETTRAAEEQGVASIVLADGPAGLRLNQTYQYYEGKIEKQGFMDSFFGGVFAPAKAEKRGDTYYQYCTAIPVGTLLAQSWDVELVREVGEMIGKEMELFEVTLWLAPGMNIHRNPLCGRNFEYYSEDPLLAGMMAGAMTLGVQTVPGCGTTIKHFACNNLEDNRMGNDSVIGERALREIYLKNFEIAIKNAQPMSIMTSYNMINGVHTANSYDLCTKVARDEWGFAGAIMTDWTTSTNSTAGECNAAGCMKAGNDMVMPGDPLDHESIKNALADGSLSINELKRCIHNTINLVLQSNQYEDAVSYSKQFDNLNTWITVE